MARLTRNAMNRYSKAAYTKDISRSMFSEPFTHTFTCNSGKLVPVGFVDCLPGTSVKLDAFKILARMQTPIAPVMDTAYVDFWAYFVPYRLIWENFKEFMGENPNGAWTTGKVERFIPQVDTSVIRWEEEDSSVSTGSYIGFKPGGNADHLGLPVTPYVNDQYSSGNIGKVSDLPFRAIQQVWNDWYRSTPLQDPLLINTGDAVNYNPDSADFSIYNGLLPLCRFPDYFSTALPSPQYGEATTVGVLSGYIPVVGRAVRRTVDFDEEAPIQFETVNLNLNDGGSTKRQADLSLVGHDFYDQSLGTLFADNVTQISVSGTSSDAYLYNAYADLSQAPTMATINDLRVAFQIQKYKESLARGGSRYTEILESIFGVRSPDARLQRSEYIGGERFLVNMQQVLQTSSSDQTSPQGNASGFSKTFGSGGRFEYAAPEHGIVMMFIGIRPVHSYQDGIDPYWMRHELFDFYNPLLANIGEQPIPTRALYAYGVDEDQVFGYTEAWGDYRSKRSYVSGEMRSKHKRSLDIYHYADDYAERPYLSAEWIAEDPALMDRTLAVSSDVADQFLVDTFFDLKVIHPMPPYSIPGLIDHH